MNTNAVIQKFIEDKARDYAMELVAGGDTDALREFAIPVMPGGGQKITVDTALKQPRIILRAITDISRDRFVADRIFATGTSDQVASGGAIFARSETKYPDRDAEEVLPRARYPRTGWTTQLFAAAVKKYGLEVPISYETRRRNALDEVGRAQIRLSNALVKFVDGLAMSLFLNDPNVQTMAGSGDWTTAATDIIKDVAVARSMIVNLDEGYDPDTLIVNPTQELDLLIDADLRTAMPREATNTPLYTGRPVPMLGLNQILATNRLAAGTAILLQSGVVGTVADEAPDAAERYIARSPGAGFNPVYLKTYDHEDNDEVIVRAARFPAMWLSEPKAAVVITGI